MKFYVCVFATARMASRRTALVGAIAAAGAVAWLVRSLRDALACAAAASQAAAASHAHAEELEKQAPRTTSTGPDPNPDPNPNLKPNLNLTPNPNSSPSPSPNPNQLLRVRTALGRCQQADVAIAEPPAAPNLVPTPSWSRCLAALAAGDEFYRGRGAKGEALLVRVRVRARVRARVRVRVS